CGNATSTINSTHGVCRINPSVDSVARSSWYGIRDIKTVYPLRRNEPYRCARRTNHKHALLQGKLIDRELIATLVRHQHAAVLKQHRIERFASREQAC